MEDALRALMDTGILDSDPGVAAVLTSVLMQWQLLNTHLQLAADSPDQAIPRNFYLKSV